MGHWKKPGWATAAGVLLALTLWFGAVAASADNQTPNVSRVRTDDSALPYQIELRIAKVSRTLPTLQSFAAGQYGGLWIILGGRTNGLHGFTDDPLANFPPSEQNRRIWLIDPVAGKHWSRRLSDSSLTQDQIDALSSTATESMQIGSRLYVIGGYGFSETLNDFTTFDTLSALDLPSIILWVRRYTNTDLAEIIRQTSHPVLKVTGGQVTMLGDRAILAFGQLFEGGYGDPNHTQIYTTQIRSFTLRDNGSKVSIRDVRSLPRKPNPTDFRRRDYTLIPFIEVDSGREVPMAAALAGVFTLTDGMFTVPVEIGKNGRPEMADPGDPATFKQAMSGYNCAFLPIWDAAKRQSHAVLFGGISYVYYRWNAGKFIEDPMFPFINDITSVVRNRDGRYRQFLIGRFPRVVSADNKRLRFGAEAAVFLDPAIPTTPNGMVDLAALKATFGNSPVVVGRLFGGIAADAGNDGNTVASNLLFDVILTPR
jgi:hypothetical protein